jgi:hypothetical protein
VRTSAFSFAVRTAASASRIRSLTQRYSSTGTERARAARISEARASAAPEIPSSPSRGVRGPGRLANRTVASLTFRNVSTWAAARTPSEGGR